MKYLLLTLCLWLVTCKPAEKKPTKHERVDDGDVLQPPGGYGNKDTIQRERFKDDSLVTIERAVAFGKPQCVTVATPTQTAITANTVSITWPTYAGISKFYIYKGGIYDGQVNNANSYTAQGLLPGQSYVFQVAAVAKGNKACPLSGQLLVTTPVAPQPPGPGGDGTPNVVLLMFDAIDINSPQWSSSTISSPGSGLTTDKRLDVFERIKAMYFGHPRLSFTMDKSFYDLADPGYRQMVVFTTNSSWYGTAGGVSYVGSFNTNTPNFVFTELLNYVSLNAALAGAHELGHALGCYHNVDTCTQSYGLSRLCADGVLRAPVMGGSYADIEHYFYTTLRATAWAIKGISKNDCLSHNEDDIIESHQK